MTTYFILELRMLSIKMFLKIFSRAPSPNTLPVFIYFPPLLSGTNPAFSFLSFFPSVRLRDIKLTAACLCCLTELAHVDHY